MPLEMKDQNRVELIRPNILLYGQPGSAKTTSALSMPGGKLALNFDSDNATLLARQIDSEGSILEPIFRGEQTLNEVEAEAKKDSPFCDVVTVDPVGDLHRKLLEEWSKYAVRPSRDVYGDVAVRVERFCRTLVEEAPNVSVVLVCHDDPVKDEQTGQIIRAPFTGTSNPKLGRKLMAMVDVVAYTGSVTYEKDDDERGVKAGMTDYMAQLVSANGRIAKSRWPALGKSRLLARALPDGTPDPSVKGLAEWVQAINDAAKPQED